MKRLAEILSIIWTLQIIHIVREYMQLIGSTKNYGSYMVFFIPCIILIGLLELGDIEKND